MVDSVENVCHEQFIMPFIGQTIHFDACIFITYKCVKSLATQWHCIVLFKRRTWVQNSLSPTFLTIVLSKNIYLHTWGLRDTPVAPTALLVLGTRAQTHKPPSYLPIKEKKSQNFLNINKNQNRITQKRKYKYFEVVCKTFIRPNLCCLLTCTFSMESNREQFNCKMELKFQKIVQLKTTKKKRKSLM